MTVRIYDTTPALEAAKLIYEQFDVDQMCTITGFEKVNDKYKQKGQAVLDELARRDKVDNMYLTKQGLKRKAKKWENSIGGHKANKCFKYDFKMIDNEPRYTIWRVQ